MIEAEELSRTQVHIFQHTYIGNLEPIVATTYVLTDGNGIVINEIKPIYHQRTGTKTTRQIPIIFDEQGFIDKSRYDDQKTTWNIFTVNWLLSIQS